MQITPTDTWQKINDFSYHIRDKKYGAIFVYIAKREMKVEELDAALNFLYTWNKNKPPEKGSVNYILQPILP